MVLFNPQIPDTQDPNYFHYSKPIEDPKFQSTEGEALKNVGHIFEGAIKGADAIVTAFAEKDAQDIAETERDKYTSVLATGKSLLDNPPMPSVSTPAEPFVGPMPPDVAKSIDAKAGTYSSAKANGQLTETDFYARMSMLAKDTKSRYPVAYGSDIDKIFAKYSGGDPANEYIKSVLGVINSYQTNAQHLRNEQLSSIKKLSDEGNPSSDAIFKAWQNNYPADQIQGAITEANVQKYKTEEGKRRLEQYHANEEVAGKAAETFIGSQLSEISRRNASLVYDKLRPGGMYVDDNGNMKVGPEAATALATQMQSWKLSAQQEMLNKLNEVYPGTTKTFGELINAKNPKRSSEMLTSNLEAFDFYEKAITDEKSGWVTAYTRMNKAADANATYSLYRSVAGKQIQLIKAVREAAGEGGVEKIFNSLYKSKLPEDIAAYKAIQTLDLLNTNIKNPSNPQSINESMEQARRDLSSYDLPQYYDAFLTQIDEFPSDQNAVTSRSTALSLANPKNRGLIEKINPNGQLPTYIRLTNQAVVDKMWEENKGDARIFPNYTNWVEITTGNLFNTYIKDLAVRQTELPPKGQLRWDSDNTKLHYDYGGIRDYQDNGPGLESLRTTVPLKNFRELARIMPDQISNERISDSVRKVNEAIAPLARVAAKDPTINVNERVLDFLKTSGVDLKDIKGVPAAMVEAILAANKKKEHLDQLQKEDKK